MGEYSTTLIDKHTLMSGVDIPFQAAGVAIHQPTLKELGYITEKSFLEGLDLLTISKNRLKNMDKTDSETVNNFNIFMTIMIEGYQDTELQNKINSVSLLLSLLFTSYDIQFDSQGIVLMKKGDTPKFINAINFDDFQNIIKQMFCLDEKKQSSGYNPAGAKARELAEKFAKRHEKLKKNNKREGFSYYEKLVSILSIGLHIPIPQIEETYTVYQLQNSFTRFNKKDSWDNYVSAKIQGATGMDEVKHWFNDLISPEDDDC